MLGFLKNNKLVRAGAVLAFFSLASDLAGLLRDRILAHNFGASRLLDVYYSAFKIPDLVFNLIIMGSVSSAFIPAFIEHYQRDKDRAWRLSKNFINSILVVVVAICVLVFIFATPLASLIAPGFTGNDRRLVIQLTRLMLLSPIIFSASTVIGSILQSFERFWAYAVAPVMYNIGIIIGALFIVPIVASHGYSPVFGLGLGVVLGALLHLITQIPSAFRAGFRLGKVFDWKDESMRKIFKLMIPRTIGAGAYSIDSAVTNAIASTMAAGSIAVLSFANNLQFVPISVVGISVATVVFPGLSASASLEEKSEFKFKLKNAIKHTLAIVVPLAILMAIFSRLIIGILYGTGLFKGTSITLTAEVLSIFMIGVIAQSLVPTVSRAFYALKNTKIPVLISTISILADVGFALLFSFVFHWGVRGLALAFAIAGNINFFLLYIKLKKFMLHN